MTTSTKARCMLPKIDTNFSIIHWTDKERNKEYHLLPEALAERIVQYLTDHILWDMEPGYTEFDTERRAILEEMTK